MYVPLIPTALRELQYRYRGDKECGIRYAATNVGKNRTSVEGAQGQNTCR